VKERVKGGKIREKNRRKERKREERGRERKRERERDKLGEDLTFDCYPLYLFILILLTYSSCVFD